MNRVTLLRTLLTLPLTLAARGMCLALFVLSTALGNEFEVFGRYDFMSFWENGTNAAHLTGRFSVRTGERKWEIIDAPDKDAPRVEVMFDGDTVYSITRNFRVQKEDAKNPALRALLTFDNRGAYATTASLSSGEYPSSAPQRPRELWFAFLSAGTLKSQSPLDMPAPWRSAFSPEPNACTANVTWSDTSHGFPGSIVFKASAERWERFSLHRLGAAKTNGSPFPDGFNVGIYNVTKWTNVHLQGMEFGLPLKFQFEWFYPSARLGGSFLNEREAFNVTGVSEAKQTISLPSLPASAVSILDGRFADTVRPQFTITYQITNQLWRTKDDLALKPLLTIFNKQYADLQSGKVRFGKQQYRAPPRRRFLIILLCAATLVSLPAVFLFKKSLEKSC